MGKMQSHNHMQNQKGWKQPMSKPSPSTVIRVGVTGPIQKPSPTSKDQLGVLPRGSKGGGNS